MEKTEQSLKDTWGISTHLTCYSRRKRREKREWGQTKIFEERVMAISPDLVKDKCTDSRGSVNPKQDKHKENKTMPRPSIVKLLKTKDKGDREFHVPFSATPACVSQKWNKEEHPAQPWRIKPPVLWGHPPIAHILCCAGDAVLQISKLQKTPSFISAQPLPVSTVLSAEQRGQLQGEKSLLSPGYPKVSNALERGPRTLPRAPTVSMCVLRLTSSARGRGLYSFRGSLLTCSTTLWIIGTGAVSMARTSPLSLGRKVVVLGLFPLLPLSGRRQRAL